MMKISPLNNTSYSFKAGQPVWSNQMQPYSDFKKENQQDSFISTKTILGLTALAFAGLGLYILSRGRKGTKTIQTATTNASEAITNNPKITETFQEILNGKSEKFSRFWGPEELIYSIDTAGTKVKPNLKGTLFREFDEINIKNLSEEQTAKIISEIREEVIANANKRCEKLGVKTRVTKSEICKILYEDLRVANYSAKETFAGNPASYEKVLKTCHAKGISSFIDKGEWIYHTNIPATSKAHSVQRITLNTQINEDFISFLDNYIAKNNIQAKYKMPADLTGAQTRPDTFNIYFLEKPSPKILKDIATEAQKYARNPENIAEVGEKLANGVFTVAEANTTEINDLCKIIAAISKQKLIPQKNQFYREIRGSYCLDVVSPATPEIHKSISAGSVEAAKIFIRKFIEKANKISA